MPYQPTNPQPYLCAVDGSTENLFKCLINPKDKIIKYVLTVTCLNTTLEAFHITGEYANSTFTKTLYIDGKSKTLEKDDFETGLPVYGSNDESGILSVKIPSNIAISGTSYTLISNGLEYSWNIELHSEQYSSSGDTYVAKYNTIDCDTKYVDIEFEGGWLPGFTIDRFLNMLAGKDAYRITYDNQTGFKLIVGSRDYAIRPPYYCFAFIGEDDKWYIRFFNLSDSISTGNGTAHFYMKRAFFGNTEAIMDCVVKNGDAESNNRLIISNADVDSRTINSDMFKYGTNQFSCEVVKSIYEQGVLYGFRYEDDRGIVVLGEDVGMITVPINNIKSPEYYFSTASEPTVSFTKTLINNKIEVEGSVEYQPGEYLSIEYYNFELKCGSDVIDLSDDTFSQVITYSYDGLINEREYDLYLNVVFENGVKQSVNQIFTCSYSDDDTSGASMNVTKGDCYVEVEVIPPETQLKYVISKKNINEDKMYPVAHKINACTIRDYNVSNGCSYEYVVTPYLESQGENVVYKPLTQTIDVNFDAWSLVDIVMENSETDSFTVLPENKWILSCAQEDIQYKINSPRNMVENSSQYPFVNASKQNYIEGTINVLLGKVECENSEYTGDTIGDIKRWKNFCSNGNLKLFKDGKGHKLIVCITDVSYTSLEKYVGKPTETSFNIVEVLDSDKYSIYERVV